MDGIIGNASHYAEGTSYHVPRHACHADAYSVIHPADRKGDPYAASALDIGLPDGPDSTMTHVTERIYHAMHNRDPRVRGMVEFAGTLNGTVTFAFYRYSHTHEVGTWDDSHLYHIHISGKRENVNNKKAWDKMARVIAGVPMTRSEKLWAAASRKRHGVKAI